MIDDAELAAIDVRMAAGYPLDVDVYGDRRKLRTMLDEARAHAERLWQALIDIEEISYREGNEFWDALYKCGATARRALAATALPGEGT
jgi:hypothetical protein